jgi:gamma-glutamyl-gamma-aminobutyrate hydrolase PuuD
MKLYVECLKQGIPMLGICRGAQFLHVMNGGKLWQDVDNHGATHSMKVLGGSETIDRVSSTHHQMVRPHKGMQVLAIADESTEKWATPTMVQRHKTVDIEAFFYRDTCCLGIQGHPEYKGYNRFTLWALKQIEQCIQHCPDIESKSGVYRLKKEFILERAGLDKPGKKEKK